MLKINNITIKNFLSVGAVTQSVRFNNRGLTLILGENLDEGGNGARNGVGKSLMIQALSYALYDSAITSIKKDNLINKTNGKNMLVSVDFEVNGKKYRVERGRKPNVFRFFINGIESEDKDESQGEARKTQVELQKILGMSQEMFKHIVVLSTYTQPFPMMRANEQRVVIEELLGITLLSEKAEILKKQVKRTRDSIKAEDVRINTLLESNDAIEKSINRLKVKSKNFDTQRENSITEMIKAIDSLEEIDIEEELKSHKSLEEYKENEKNLKTYKKYVRQYEANITDLSRRIEKQKKNLIETQESKCPTCGQEIHDDKHEALIDGFQKNLQDLLEQLDPIEKEYKKYKRKVEEIGNIGEEPKTFYSSIDDAYQHRENLNQLKQQLENEFNQENPYDDQIKSLEEEAIQEISYVVINDLKKLLEHQEFLHKLLTSKDSFIRKKIIDQNLSYLNSRLSYYLNKLGLPHTVEFKNDLNLEIILLGQEFDFGQLSRGQQNRVILGLSWAFRDVWESIGHPINILFIDEMVDSGIDTVGVENTLEILKKQARERKKDIFLISHREDLINRVHNVLTVILENGFTSYSNQS